MKAARRDRPTRGALRAALARSEPSGLRRHPRPRRRVGISWGSRLRREPILHLGGPKLAGLNELLPALKGGVLPEFGAYHAATVRERRQPNFAVIQGVEQ